MGMLTRLRDLWIGIRRRHATALAGSFLAVAIVTGAVFGLRIVAPVLGLGALYVLAIVGVASLWGLAYAIPVSIASMLAFNWFFLEPVHSFHLHDSENWLVLAVYLVTAVVVSELAARARRRAGEAEQGRREAALLAEIAGGLMQRGVTREELDSVSGSVARTLGLTRARVVLDPSHLPERNEAAEPLVASGARIGVLLHPRNELLGRSLAGRMLPALASLLAVAVERERLANEAFEAEALRRSDNVKTAILRTVSHDFRSPLTAIRAASDGLASRSLELSETDRRDLVDSIRSEARRLQRLVENLLDLSKLEAGAAEPERAIWPVEELIGRALDALGEQGARVKLALPRRSLLLEIDATQIERALVNLLENAIDVSPPGTSVDVRALRRAGRVEIRVEDRGHGIRPKDAERIFEPFFRAGEKREGAGLGLAIVRGFVEANGGQASLRPHRGGGACFTLSFPEAAEEVLEA
jgi:two-component system sensor histidine kinase KdpD